MVGGGRIVGLRSVPFRTGFSRSTPFWEAVSRVSIPAGEWSTSAEPPGSEFSLLRRMSKARPIVLCDVDAAVGICLWLGQKLLKRLPIVRFPAFQEAGRCTLGGSALQRLVGHR